MTFTNIIILSINSIIPQIKIITSNSSIFFSIALNLINLHLNLINEVLTGKCLKPFCKNSSVLALVSTNLFYRENLL